MATEPEFDLSELCEADDASRYLDGLSEEEHGSQFQADGDLSLGAEGFSQEERDIVFNNILPL